MSNELDAKLNEIATDALTVVEQNNRFIIRGEKSLVEASEFLLAIKSRIKKIEELRQFFVKPLNDQVKAINAKFKEASVSLEQVEKQVSQKIVEYRRKEAERIAEERRVEEERQRKEFEAEQARLAEEAKKLKGAEKKIALSEIPQEFMPEVDLKQRTVINTDRGTLKTRKLWKAQIVDETKVPREYLSVDTVKINTAIRNGIREIEGVRIFQEESLI